MTDESVTVIIGIAATKTSIIILVNETTRECFDNEEDDRLRMA